MEHASECRLAEFPAVGASLDSASMPISMKTRAKFQPMTKTSQKKRRNTLANGHNKNRSTTLRKDGSRYKRTNNGTDDQINEADEDVFRDANWILPTGQCDSSDDEEEQRSYSARANEDSRIGEFG